MSRPLPLLCLFAASVALAQGEGIRLKARLDWAEQDAITKKGRWHPVQVELENRSGKDIEGKVWVEVEVGNGMVLDLRYQRALALPREAKKRFVLDVRLEGGESSVFVHADIGGFAAIRAIPILWVEDDVDPILVVGKWPKAYLVRLEKRNPGPHGEEYFPQRYVTQADPDDFPDSWRGLDGVETIVWDGVQMTDLSAAQAQAIEDWVSMGGSLVLSGGSAIESYYKSPLGKSLPGRYAERVEVDVEQELARKVGLPAPRKSEKFLAARIAGVDAPAWASAEKVPLLVERSLGLGRVCVVPFDLPCDQVMGAKGADLLLDHLVGRRGFSVLRSTTPYWIAPGLTPPVQVFTGRGSRANSRYWVRTNSDSPSLELSLDRSLPDAFSMSSGVRVPPARNIAVFLGLYIAACLANLLAWRAAHRREFAWASLLLLSLGFAGYSWRDAALNAQAAPSVQHVTIIELGPDGLGGRQTSWFGFFTNISQDVEVAATGPREALTLPDLTRVRPIGASEVEVTEDGRAPRIPELSLLPRSVSCVKTERAAQPEAIVAVRAWGDGKDVRVGVVPPAWGTALAPVLVHGSHAILLDLSSEGNGFLGRLSEATLAERQQPLAEMAASLQQHGVTQEVAAAILAALSYRSRNGDPSWLVVPLLDAPAHIRWAGQDVGVDRGVTVLIVPMQWDGCLSRATSSLTPFCRSTMCEKSDEGLVWEFQPLWRDGPGVGGLRSELGCVRSFFNWKSGAWVGQTPVWALHPFRRTYRVRQSDAEVRPEGYRFDSPDPHSPPDLYPD